MSEYWKRREKRIVEHFRNWLGSQKTFRNRREIAEHLDIGESHLSRIAGGSRRASDSVLRRIATLTQFGKREDEGSLSQVDGERPYLDFAEQLRKWFFNQDKLKTQTELADHLGMPRSSCGMFFQGRSFPKGRIRRTLFEMTGIDMLRSEGRKQDISKGILPKSQKIPPLQRHLEEIGRASRTIQRESEALRKHVRESRKHIQSIEEESNPSGRVVVAFYALAEELMTFRDSEVPDRKKLRRLLSPKDVGYVISFLKALYDEDRFSNFIFFTEYEFEGEVLDK
ncbi:MAG: hypothetical protein ACW99J_15825 [Candidatus Thorarchaeota archaeon]